MRPNIKSGYRGGDIGEKLVAWALGLALAGWLAFSVVGAIQAACAKVSETIVAAGARHP